MNIISLFDGMSCGQIAINRLGLKYDKYFASEIDKYAKHITQKNYPNTIHIGDVRYISYKNGTLYTPNGNYECKIDLIIGGSPCTDLSLSGKQTGLLSNDLETYLKLKESETEFKGQSYLFWEYLRLLNEIRPTYFLLENVKMSFKWRDIITENVGYDPILINSSLLSAQNRERYYWTNIPNIEQPKDKGIYLKDIVEENKTALGLAQRGRYKDGKIVQKYEMNGKEKSNCLTTVQKDTLVFIPIDEHSSTKGLICIGGLKNPKSKMWINSDKILQRNFNQGNRVYSEEGKSVTLSANGGGIGGKTGLYEIEGYIRKLTVMECERLQTVPENYTEGVSKTQALKMLGNGWTIDVIVHILRNIL